MTNGDQNLKTILVVEDDPGIQELLRLNLSRVNYKVRQALNADQAWVFLKCGQPDLMLVDWNMPRQSGIELVRSLRSQPEFQAMPIIMVTARYTEQDKLAAFEAGVDDVVSKPFHVRELLARVHAKLLRAQYDSRTQAVLLGGLYVCPDSSLVRQGALPLKMGETEIRLLYHLARQPGKVLGRTELIQLVWGTEAEVQERTVDAYVVRLRLILKNAGCAHQIHTVRAVGYRLEMALQAGVGSFSTMFGSVGPVGSFSEMANG